MRKSTPNGVPNQLKIGANFIKNRSVKLNTSESKWRKRFFNFGFNFRVPKWSQNLLFFTKQSLKKVSCFRIRFFIEFYWILPPNTIPKQLFFDTFFENVDFVKIVVSPRRNHYFSGSEPLKITRKSSRKRVRKNGRSQIRFQADLGSVWGGFLRQILTKNTLKFRSNFQCLNI